MKLKDVKEPGFYTNDLETREYIYEVIINDDKEWLKEDPTAILIVDEWDYDYTNDEEQKHYIIRNGNMYNILFANPKISVYKIKDTEYTKPYGQGGTEMHEIKKKGK